MFDAQQICDCFQQEGDRVAFSYVPIHQLQRLARQIDIRGKHQDGDERLKPFHPFRHDIAIHFRHLVVENDEIDRLCRKQRQCVTSVLRRNNTVSL